MNKRYCLAAFQNEDDILAACVSTRKRGWKIVDVHSPYAVHGLEKAMGLPPSDLTYVCFAFGALGVITALIIQFWTSAIDWPINVGGRPWNSLPAYVPVTFELMVLFAGLGTVLGFFLNCRLFPGKQEILVTPRVTDNQFILIIEQSDSTFDPVEMKAFFEGLNATSVEERDMVTAQ